MLVTMGWRLLIIHILHRQLDHPDLIVHRLIRSYQKTVKAKIKHIGKHICLKLPITLHKWKEEQLKQNDK